MTARASLVGILAVIAGACGSGGERSLAGTHLTVDDFRFIGAHTTMQDVIARVGAPGGDIGSGIHIYLYRLEDGTLVWIGSPDGSEILYVRHVGRLPEQSSTLYERRRG